MKTRLSVYDVAALLEVSAGTVCRWVNEGVLPKPERDGRRVYWCGERMAEWAEAAYPGREFNYPADDTFANL